MNTKQTEKKKFKSVSARGTHNGTKGVGAPIFRNEDIFQSRGIPSQKGKKLKLTSS